MFVAVTVIAPVAPLVLMFDNVIPDAAVSPPAQRREVAALGAVPEALSSVNVTLWPAPSPTPLARLTV